jgi:hypothetical protein
MSKGRTSNKKMSKIVNVEENVESNDTETNTSACLILSFIDEYV